MNRHLKLLCLWLCFVVFSVGIWATLEIGLWAYTICLPSALVYGQLSVRWVK